MGSLANEDMFIEILTRLPIKSFSRSKCVSKSWHSLLSHDYLRKKLPLILSGVIQPSRSSLKNKPIYISNIDNSDFKATPLDFFPFHSTSTLIDCSNGLLLFYTSFSNTFYVCNPTTKKYAKLPRSCKESLLSILAFDPYYSEQYKVVNFTGWLDHGATFEVFDSESQKWIECEANWGVDTSTLSSTMRYMDGVLYILAPSNKVVGINMNDTKMMKCSVFELPEVVKNECSVGKVEGEFTYCGYDGKRIRVWAMVSKGAKSEWVLKHDVCFGNGVGEIRVLGLNSERTGLVYLSKDEKLVAFDLCGNRIEEAWEMGKVEKGCLIQIWAFPFTKHMENCLSGSI